MEDWRKPRTIKTILFRLSFKHTRNLKRFAFSPSICFFNSLARVKQSEVLTPLTAQPINGQNAEWVQLIHIFTKNFIKIKFTAALPFLHCSNKFTQTMCFLTKTQNILHKIRVDMFINAH
jgi:hypothetical protein